MKNKRTVVFDLDGTLVESAPDLLDSLNFCLEQSGYSTIKPHDLHHLVGQGGRVMIERALSEQSIEPTEDKVSHLLDLFLENYTENMPGKTRYFNGVDETLDNLAKSGFLLAVCTNKYEALAKRLLDAIEPKKRFAVICGGDTFAWRKPDPRHIFSTIEKAGGLPEKSVMVGDSRADIDAAKGGDIPVVAVDFGYTDIPVHQLSPTRIVSQFSEITPEFIESLIEND